MRKPNRTDLWCPGFAEKFPKAGETSARKLTTRWIGRSSDYRREGWCRHAALGEKPLCIRFVIDACWFHKRLQLLEEVEASNDPALWHQVLAERLPKIHFAKAAKRLRNEHIEYIHAKLLVCWRWFLVVGFVEGVKSNVGMFMTCGPML